MHPGPGRALAGGDHAAATNWEQWGTGEGSALARAGAACCRGCRRQVGGARAAARYAARAAPASGHGRAPP